MKIVCTRCEQLYDEGFYAQHRVLPEHCIQISKRQVRHGGPTTSCMICDKDYPTGEYDAHKTTNGHLSRTKYGVRLMARMTGLDELMRRDTYIKDRVLAGDSYGTLARELQISRQRVHQIAKEQGVASHAKRTSVVSVAKTCFFDGATYGVWDAHAATSGHEKSVMEFALKVGTFKRTPE